MSLPFARPDIGDDEVEAVVECMKSGWLTSGSKVQEFEAKFAAFTGAKHAIAVSSATVGALLILDALGIGLGDEVIVPAMTFSGPAMMAHRLGANVVLADCLPGSHQLDPADVARKITPRTKVVMPTHFAGEACDLEALQSLCATHGVLLIDDAAHALPTVDKSGDRVGSGASSLATFFSFYATKTLTTGDGGMITTNEDWLAERIRPLRSHGMSRPVFDRYSRLGASWQYDIELPGWKANMTDVEAAMGLVQLKRQHEMADRRRYIAQSYAEAFEGLDVTTPNVDENHAAHLYVIRLNRTRRGRACFIATMAELGVQCSVHFIPLHMHTFWRAHTGLAPADLPNTLAIFEQSVSLPIFSTMTDADVELVVRAVKTALERT